MSRPSNSGVEFLSPNTISCIIVLKEYSQRHNELDPSNPFANFLINKIMRLNEEEEAQSSSQFFKKMIKESQNFEISERYRQQVERIQSLHDLFSYLQTTIKELRQNRCSRVEQGNVIDLFLRRSALNFGKCGFSDMVKLYQNFADYKNDQYRSKRLGPSVFLSDKKLEDLQLKILNFDNCYSYGEIQKQLEEIESRKPHQKVAYLKAHNEARNHHPLAALDNIHRYFDKQLELLFSSEKQSETQVPYNQSQVNHCILNLAYLNLEMGLVDECLKSLGEAMRISQNNQDEESINHCIMYLYEMSALLSHPQDAIVLTNHSIWHSLTQLSSSPLLLLHSCLSLAQFSKHFDIENTRTKHNHNWVETLHLATRRIIQNYEASILPGRKQPKVVLLQIPRVMEQLVKCLLFDAKSQPGLVDLLLNCVNESTPQLLAATKSLPILFELAYNQLDYDLDKSITLFEKLYEFMNNRTKPHYRAILLLSNAYACIQRAETISAEFLLDKLIEETDSASAVPLDPVLRAKIQQIQIQLLLKEGKYAEAHTSILNHIQFATDSGLLKHILTQAYIFLLILKYNTKDLFSALPLIQKVVVMAKQHQLRELYAVAKLYKVQILFQQGYIQSTLKIIKKLEERWLSNFSGKTQALFYYVKAILMLKIASSYQKNDIKGIDLQEETLKHALICLNKSLEFYINLNCLNEARIYDEMGVMSHRETAAYYFVRAEEASSNNAVSSLISTYNINDLSLYKIQLALSNNFKRTFKIISLPATLKSQ